MRHTITKNELEKIYREYNSITKTSQHFGVSWATVKRYLKKYNISQITQNDIAMSKCPSREEVLEKYNTIPVRDIYKYYKINQKTFYLWLEKLGIDKRDSLTRKKNFKFPPKLELEDVYYKLKSIAETSKFFGVSRHTIKKWMVYYNIEILSHKETCKKLSIDIVEKKKPSKDFLKLQYSKMSIKELAEYYKISNSTTIQGWLDDYNIHRRDNPARWRDKRRYDSRIPPEKELRKKYKELGSCTMIEDYYKVSPILRRQWFKQYNIKTIIPWRSKGENEVFEYLKSMDSSWVSTDRRLINPYELDMVNHNTKTAVEYCGHYWHGQYSSGKDKKYHKNKYDMCKNIGYKLITIFEGEWVGEKNLIVRSILNTSPVKIYARNTEVRYVEPSKRREFFNKNHIQGDLPSTHAYGLYIDEELIMCISYVTPRSNRKYDFEIARMATKLNTCVLGGASKLFKNSIKIKGKSVITYTDLRYGNGEVYKHMGFEFSHVSSPNYFYFKLGDDSLKLYTRNKFQKHKLSKLLPKFDSSLTEWDNMKENKYDRIFDCGNNTFILK